MSNQSDTPTFKLYYFNVKGLAEPIRFLFAYGGENYEDIRVNRDDWPSMKLTMPMGQLPVLDINGDQIHQSLSIARYVGKRVGLGGNNEYENLKIDVAADTVNDFRQKMAEIQYEQDEVVKEKKRSFLKSVIIPFCLEKLEAVAEKNNGHLALSRLTWADFYLAGILDSLNHMAQDDLIKNCSNLRKVVEKVYQLESIKEWINKRPQTNF